VFGGVPEPAGARVGLDVVMQTGGVRCPVVGRIVVLLPIISFLHAIS
jgi:hypothetical protein